MSKEKLPVAFKKKWVKALLSGKFRQGKSYLKVKEHDHEKDSEYMAYCCLGVACEVAKAKIIIDEEPAFITTYNEVRGISKIPNILRGDSGLPAQLATMNDNGKSFKSIAKWIDKNL